MMPSIRSLFSLLFIILIAAGCNVLPFRIPPTFIPEGYLPTVIELTAQALVDDGVIQITPAPPPTSAPTTPTETVIPTETHTPTSAVPEFTPTETMDMALIDQEPLVLPDPLPVGEIQIISPGRLSRVTSPFSIHAYLAPPRSERDVDSSYQVSLYGDDGSLLVRHYYIREADQTGNTHLLMDISFEITGAAESSRLEISSLDGFGRISALATMDLILLSDGETEIKSVLDLNENLIIQQPISSTLIQGDRLIVQGLTRFAPNDQILIELMNRDGGLVGSEVLLVSQENLGGGYRPFEGEIPYQVGSSSWIRVQVSSKDGNFSGIQHLSSVEVLVSP